MRRQFAATDRLETWANFNGIVLSNIRVKSTEDKGTGLYARTDDHPREDATLITVPKDLVLSLSLVEEYAKADRHLREVLDAVGEFGWVGAG